MSAFQIKNKNNSAIPINELDKEIAEFWGVECMERAYATSPKLMEQNSRLGRTCNWYDTIGLSIALSPLPNGEIPWKMVIAGILGSSLMVIGMPEEIVDEYTLSIKWYEENFSDHWNLIRYFNSKGYKAFKV